MSTRKAPQTKSSNEDGTTLALTKARARTHAVRGIELSVSAGPDARARFSSKTEHAVIGTAESADLVLSDPTVSRFHCEVRVTAGRITLKDLGSRNGTLVDGVSVVEAHLEPGSTLTLGNTELKFAVRAEPIDVPLSERDRFGVMVGGSLAMRRVFALLEKASESDATVVLTGETGTGKEAAAESIHLESARRDRPFVVADCSAIPADLLESELFGHERGAFTGASVPRDGLFEVAQGGTIFLDEIGELSLALQPKLLRVLERREVKRVGANRYHNVDVRVIAATNRNLRTEVNQARFRSDLYYRLAVLEVTLPPLRDRLDDLPMLVETLLGGSPSGKETFASLSSPEFLSDLASHSWPGNVRELRNYVERCVALRERAPLESDSGQAGPETLLETTLPLKTARERWNRVLERKYVETLLARHEGNVTVAARAAGVDRMYFYRLLWRYGLR